MVREIQRTQHVHTSPALGQVDERPVPETVIEPPPEREAYSVYLGPKFGIRTYQFPTHFRDVEMMAAQFILPSDAVRGWLAKDGSGLEPISTLGMTRGMVTVQHLARPTGMDPYSRHRSQCACVAPMAKKDGMSSRCR